MAIIRSSKTFEGGEFKQGGGGYLKTGTRVMNFRDKQYIDGVYVFILSAYREDASGNGVWYKPLKIRDNFGLGSKEKFAVQPNCPVEYFAERMKTYAPSQAKIEKIKDAETGKDRTLYPVFGRTTYRVLYNAAFFNQLKADEIHVLDLPASGGGSAIDEFVRGKQPDGADNPLLNDYQAALPVHIKLDLKAAGQPWKLRVNDSKPYVLPDELADTDNLYNLDDVVLYPSKQELIEKLKTIVPAPLFAQCMAGYSDGSVTTISTPVNVPNSREDDDLPFMPKTVGVAKPAAKPARPAPTAVAPAFPLPSAEPEVPIAEEDDLPRPPVATTATTAQQARDFLRRASATTK